MSDTKKPWEQMDGERDKDYSMFLVFLELGIKRTLVATIAKCSNGDTTRNKAIETVCIKNKWRERASAFDKESNLARLQSAENAAKEFKDQVLELGTNIAKGANALLKAANQDDIEKLRYTLVGLEMVAGKGTIGNTVANLHKAIVGQKQEVEVSGKSVTIEFPMGKDEE